MQNRKPGRAEVLQRVRHSFQNALRFVRLRERPVAKFCGHCGTTLGASAATPSAKKIDETRIRVKDALAPEDLEGERKTVTALFADIKGSMELIEDLDPKKPAPSSNRPSS